jgi:uncharacterized RDD family membrane protein YckC
VRVEERGQTESETVKGAAYGRFSRRLRAFVIDGIIIALMCVAALSVAVAAESDNVGRIVGIVFVASWLLYEPVLVSVTGSSIGHYLSNLRVVDDRTHGKVGFLKAIARFVIKTLLGVYSFITMAVTSRHQAVHDLLTRSTVQIRDPSKASLGHYVAERTDLPVTSRASRTRRIVVTLVYLFFAFVLMVLAEVALVSPACLDLGKCSQADDSISTVVGLVGLGVIIMLIVQGWRSRLYGCRLVENKSP